MVVTYSNSEGAVCIADGGVPRIITVKARANISGGYWVNGSSAQSVVGSMSSSYVASDIEGYPVSTTIGSAVIGIALTDIASGTYGPVAMRGIYLMPQSSGTRIGSILAGWPVAAGSAGTVFPLGSNTLLLTCIAGAVGPLDMKVGKSLTDGPNNGDGYVAVSVNI